MTYTLVFDAAQNPADYGPIVRVGVPLFCIGLLLVARPALMQSLMPRGLQGSTRTIFSWFFFIVSTLITTALVANSYTNHETIAASLKNGHYQSIEGLVGNFVPMPYEGHSQESFVVSGKRFAYSDYIATAGFHQTASHGGPIRQGLPVRIAYTGNLILRLEVGH